MSFDNIECPELKQSVANASAYFAYLGASFFVDPQLVAHLLIYRMGCS
jgi:hypothetical protein